MIKSHRGWCTPLSKSTCTGKRRQFALNMKKWARQNKAKGGSISEMGYRDDSPYRNNPYIDINTPQGLIDMSNTGIPLFAKDETGYSKMLPPYSGMHKFQGKRVREIPMAQKGLRVPAGLIPNNSYSGDIQSYYPQNKPITQTAEQAAAANAWRQEVKKQKNSAILADRKARITNSISVRNKPYSPENIAQETGAIGDKMRLFPNDPDSFIDEYLNPFKMVGDMATGLGRIPLNIKEGNYGEAAMSVAAPLGVGALTSGKTIGQFTNNMINPFAEGLGNYVRKIDNKYIYPRQFKNELKELQKSVKYSHDQFNNPEAVRRLREMGINPYGLQFKNLNVGSESNNIGSYYSPTFDNINIDLRQAKQLAKTKDLSTKQILEHEIGHKLQRDFNINSSDFKGIKHELEARSQPTYIDYEADNLKFRDDLNTTQKADLNYFKTGSGRDNERMPFLREMRQDMIDKGVIKEQYQNIDKEHLNTYFNSGTKNRLANILDVNKKHNIINLRNILNNLPIAALPIAGTATLSQQKRGGMTNPYKMQEGGYIPNAVSPYDLLDETDTAQYSLQHAKNLRMSKNGRFNGLIPMDAWNDDMKKGGLTQDQYLKQRGLRDANDEGDFDNIPPKKAREILHSKKLNGKPLTPEQYRLFGYLSNLELGGNPYMAEGRMSAREQYLNLFSDEEEEEDIQAEQAKMDDEGTPTAEQVELEAKQQVFEEEQAKWQRQQEEEYALGLAMGSGGGDEEIARRERRARGRSVDVGDVSDVPSLNSNKNSKYAFEYYKSKGLAPHIAAGIVGNLAVESIGFDPNVISGKRQGDNNVATGVAQWHPKRFKGLLNWAKASGKNPYALETQLDYVLVEPGEGPRVLEKLKAAKNSGEAAVIFDKVYERSAGLQTKERVGYARNLNPYKNGGTIK